LGAGATIEASTSVLGMRRVDLVVEDEATMLTPSRGRLRGGGSSQSASVPGLAV
jgi:hypothetical protein